MTTKTGVPQAADWNHYWTAEQTERFTRVSWSKRRIMRILKPYMATCRSALDAGCGSGFFTNYFIEQGLTATALDYSEKALSLAEEATRGRAKLVKEDLTRPGLCERLTDRYDVIFSDGLLEHFPKSEQSVIYQNFIQVLSHSGIIVTFVPNRWSPWELIRPFFMPGIDETPFVMKELVDLNRKHDLTILSRGGINTFPFAVSPDAIVGNWFGMLLYTISRNGKEMPDAQHE